MTRIAVIGAGLSGLVVANSLADRAEVTVFEKSRGAGGRMATRYADDREFDHGAQFFTARTAAFREFLAPLVDEGLVQSWNAAFAEIDRHGIRSRRQWNDDYPHFVGVPRMNVIGKALADSLDVRYATTVAELRRDAARWRLSDNRGRNLGRYDWVIASAPAAQTAALLPGATPLARHAASVQQKSCFALMLGFDNPLDPGWEAALVRDADISWISVNSSKPGRPSSYSLVAHATNAWADAHLDDEPASVRAHMLQSVSNVLGADARTASHIDLHRWRYANVDRQPAAPQVDSDNRLAACGDWFVRGRVESAFTSARRLTDALDALL